MRRLFRKNPRRVVPTLALLATGFGALAVAEDRPFDNQPNPPPVSPTTGPGAGTTPLAPGRPNLFSPNNDRQVFIQGLLDADWVTNNNYTDGNDHNSDSDTFARIRAELGARVELDERIEVKFTAGYAAMAGNPGVAIVDDAYVVLKELFGQPNLSVKVGRQPVSWNLRTDYGAFLFDSRANYPDVTSWDGARGQWSIETLVFTGFGYALPDNSNVYGIVMDWQPEQGRDSGLFLTLSANAQQKAIDPAAAAGVPVGKRLLTYYGGIEAKTSDGLDAWFEGALQNGNAADGRKYSGFGLSTGLDLHLRTEVPFVLGVQGDWLRGDDDTTDKAVRAFQNTWEGQQDTLIVESERYGELSTLTQTAGTGLRAAKVKGELSFANGYYRLKSIYGYYLLDEKRNGEDALGQELDLVFNWQYNAAGNAVISLMTGALLPGKGYQAIAPTQPAGNDPIFMAAANLQVSY